MGYDAVLPGGADFTAGPSFLAGREGSGVPFTCLNLVSAGGEKAVFPRSRSIDRAGLRVLVVGVLREDAIPRDTLSGLGWKILPAGTALSGFLNGEEAASADLVVVLSRLSPGESLSAARSFPVPVLLLSPPSRRGGPPVFQDGSALLRSRSKGTHLLQADVISDGKDTRAGFVEEGTTVRLKEERRRLLAEMSAMDDRRRAFYGKTLESYDGVIREAEERNELSSRWVPLDADIPDDPQVASMIEAYRRENP